MSLIEFRNIRNGKTCFDALTAFYGRGNNNGVLSTTPTWHNEKYNARTYYFGNKRVTKLTEKCSFLFLRVVATGNRKSAFNNTEISIYFCFSLCVFIPFGRIFNRTWLLKAVSPYEQFLCCLILDGLKSIQ